MSRLNSRSQYQPAAALRGAAAVLPPVGSGITITPNPIEIDASVDFAFVLGSGGAATHTLWKYSTAGAGIYTTFADVDGTTTTLDTSGVIAMDLGGDFDIQCTPSNAGGTGTPVVGTLNINPA